MTIKFRLYNNDAKSPFSSTFVNPKDFKTGSTGYFVNGKVDLPVGCAEVQAEFAGDTDLRFIVPAKDFSTGSKGFWQGDKVALDDGLYQMQVQMTLVGSGPQKKDEEGNLKPRAKNPSGRTYQYQVQLVKIGSKGAPKLSPIDDAVSEAYAAIDAAA
jgi:hypothetical protein